MTDGPVSKATHGRASRQPARAPQPRKLPTVIDLFAGAGGLTLGFAWAGFRPVLAVEHDPVFAATYAENFGSHVITRDVREALADGELDVQADVVVGGPPCQGFSNLTGNRADDPRRSLTSIFMDVVERSGCSVFIMENVPNLLTSPEGAAVMARARHLGFHVDAASMGVRLASRFGVPQNRRRAFIVGSRLGLFELPSGSSRSVSVREAFKGLHQSDRPIPLRPLHPDLPRLPAGGSDLHIGRNPTAVSLERYKAVPPGGNRFDLQRHRPDITPGCWIRKTSGGTDLFGRLAWDEPARCTIRCEFYKPEKGRYLHPSEHRPITHWEAARLQSFPDSFRWHGTRIQVAIQIGNAVPPRMAEGIAVAVRQHLEQDGALRAGQAAGQRTKIAAGGTRRVATAVATRRKAATTVAGR